MKGKIFTAAMITALILSACANREKEGNGNMEEGEAKAGTEELLAGDMPDMGTAASKAPESTESRSDFVEQNEDITVRQEGSVGTLQVVLPAGWAYEACPEGSDQLGVGDYGIHFYPEDVSEGFIELCYVDSFGVCGTGLEQEKVTLAGDEASIGTYDYGDNWDFVSFRGTNEGIVALTYAVEGWWPEYGEQTLEILDTVSLIRDNGDGTGDICGYPLAPRSAGNMSTIACGTNREPGEKSGEDSMIEELGLSLEVKDYTNTGATLVFRQSGGNPTGELIFGELYSIEKCENGEWAEVPVVVEGNYAFHMVEYTIAPDEDREFQVDWKWLYGELESGEYRIRKSVDDFRKSADYDKYEIYAYFIIP